MTPEIADEVLETLKKVTARLANYRDTAMFDCDDADTVVNAEIIIAMAEQQRSNRASPAGRPEEAP